eukprot:Gregarina_sp_Pseudo_9__2834@NODE_3064_length_765_cov_835_669421_g2794_i0_p1_GENE_NODE_3064_length_765_cov_835_669421_g2794_i0NODE_3064_length_765_cov_835_669421_g2794_i0_p1_ORF_typecomplete_len146_score8_32Sod_Fe_N/PF00081_22/1_3e13_NODE_3064_length_765_cov_835_669421_g2794_i056493
MEVKMLVSSFPSRVFFPRLPFFIQRAMSHAYTQKPELPFAQDALAPHISAETLKFHYGKHHMAYYNKMMTMTEGKSEHKDKTLLGEWVANPNMNASTFGRNGEDHGRRIVQSSRPDIQPLFLLVLHDFESEWQKECSEWWGSEAH